MIEGAPTIRLTVDNGVVLIGSDGHYWNIPPSTGHRAFVKFARKLKPETVIYNGDAFDGAGISRHAPIGWEKFPTVVDQIDACKDRMQEIANAAPRDTALIWTMGNHDARFETSIASRAPEYAKVHGVHLKDHFPDWTPAWAVDINSTLVVKHRFHGGENAARTNALHSGRSIATGHLHSLRVTPYTDYNGTRWGIDTGMLADPSGPQFTPWLEANPTNWRAGFVVCTFENKRLLWPEVVHVVGPTLVEWRGKLVEV